VLGELIERAFKGDSNARVILLLVSAVTLSAVLYWVYRVIQHRRS